MFHVLNHHPDAMTNAGTGLFARLRGWLEARRQFRAAATNEVRGHPGSSAQLLPFPIRGEALLVRMAESLRGRVGDRRWMCDPLLLTMSRRPHSRLTLDRDTYVEFDSATGGYRAVLRADPETRITVETFNFDTVVSFVAPYVTDRLSDAIPMEAAS
ncbi:MAG TPA: hypothetical protein VGM32_06375 [Rhodopila sp.]